MIDYDTERIVVGDESTPIKTYRVWFMGPTGLCPTLDLAKKMNESLSDETPFFMMFKPVPVAIGENGWYEEMR